MHHCYLVLISLRDELGTSNDADLGCATQRSSVVWEDGSACRFTTQLSAAALGRHPTFPLLMHSFSIWRRAGLEDVLEDDVAPAPAPRRDEEEPEFDEDDEVGLLDGALRTWQPSSVATHRFTRM